MHINHQNWPNFLFKSLCQFHLLDKQAFAFETNQINPDFAFTLANIASSINFIIINRSKTTKMDVTSYFIRQVIKLIWDQHLVY